MTDLNKIAGQTLDRVGLFVDVDDRQTSVVIRDGAGNSILTLTPNEAEALGLLLLQLASHLG